eukprot:1129717-Pelagomonas_calceolata.AAC.1
MGHFIRSSCSLPEPVSPTLRSGGHGPDALPFLIISHPVKPMRRCVASALTTTACSASRAANTPCRCRLYMREHVCVRVHERARKYVYGKLCGKEVVFYLEKKVHTGNGVHFARCVCVRMIKIASVHQDNNFTHYVCAALLIRAWTLMTPEGRKADGMHISIALELGLGPVWRENWFNLWPCLEKEKKPRKNSELVDQGICVNDRSRRQKKGEAGKVKISCSKQGMQSGPYRSVRRAGGSMSWNGEGDDTVINSKFMRNSRRQHFRISAVQMRRQLILAPLPTARASEVVTTNGLPQVRPNCPTLFFGPYLSSPFTIPGPKSTLDI